MVKFAIILAICIIFSSIIYATESKAEIDYEGFVVPNWVKDVAGFWYADDIDDASFLQGIQYLIQNDVIVVPVTESESEGGGTVPAWVKNNAGWWSQGAITDADFVNGIQFLIKDGLIQIN